MFYKKKTFIILFGILIAVVLPAPVKAQETENNSGNTSENTSGDTSENTYPPQAILVATYMGNATLVRNILATNPDKNIRDDFGDTALHLAMFQSNLNVVKLLLDYGFDPNAKIEHNGYTPLHNAVAANNVAAARLLLQYGANKNIRDCDGLTPLDKARKEGKQELASLLYK